MHSLKEKKGDSFPRNERTLYMNTIAKIETDFPSKFGIPRQSGLVGELEGRIVFEPAYRNPEAVRGLEQFTHIWILWKFSESRKTDWSATVKPPRLRGKKMGVFATRSPFRPNDIGLSCVRLKRIEYDSALGAVLYVSGADLLDQTPIYDIKPYLPYTDCHPEASNGFAEAYVHEVLEVEVSEQQLALVPPSKRAALIGILAQDPRPAYVMDEARLYGVSFAGFNIRFQVVKNKLTVVEISKQLPPTR